VKIDTRLLQNLDRLTLAMFTLSLAGIVLIVTLSVMTGEQQRANKTLEEQIEKIESLSGRASEAVSFVKDMEKKMASSRTKGVVPEISAILEAIDLKASVIKPLDRKKIDGLTEERASVEVEKIDLNAIVNLLYRLRSSPSPFIIRSMKMRADFEEQDKFTLNLTVALPAK
jgi:ABC-type lipoprotein release transport system permease subunit